MTHDNLLSGLGRRLPWLLSAFLIIFVGITLAKITWYWFTSNEVNLAQSDVVNTSNIKIEKTIDYGSEIANQHIFGLAPIKKVNKPVKKKVVSPVKSKLPLKLKLHGVVAGGKNSSYAIISGTGKRGQQVVDIGYPVLFINDKAVEDVLLKAVFPQYIVVDNRGVEEKFYLPRYNDELDLSANAKENNNTLGGKKKMLAHNPAASPQYVSRAINNPSLLDDRNTISSHIDGGDNDFISANKEITGAQLVKIREEVLSNPNKILDIVSVSEAKDREGNFLGFRLSPGKKRKIFRALRLRAGDIITNINGIQLDSPQRGFEVMNQLATSSTIRLIIKRGQQQLTITRDLSN